MGTVTRRQLSPFDRTMTKKVRQFFWRKKLGDAMILPHRVTPTLVTPLRVLLITCFLTHARCQKYLPVFFSFLGLRIDSCWTLFYSHLINWMISLVKP